MIITSLNQVYELRDKIRETTQNTYNFIKNQIEHEVGIELFLDLKFDKNGLDPVKGTKLNFIEQLNQLFSDLVVVHALEELINIYPDKEFSIRLGAKAGFDIESSDHTIVAECFAVTEAKSNNKLKKDADKLCKNVVAKKKYIFFFSKNDEDGKLEKIYQQYSNIEFRRIYEFLK